MSENFHIFIASCFEGLDIQVPRLINNIIECNIPCEYVHWRLSRGKNLFY